MTAAPAPAADAAAALSVAVGAAGAAADARPDDKSCHRRVDRLCDFPAGELEPRSLEALGILVASRDLAAAAGDRFHPMDLSSFVPALKPGASVHVCVTAEGDGGGSDGGPPSPSSAPAPAGALQRVHSAFVLAGLRVGSESKRPDGSRVLSATFFPPPASGGGPSSLSNGVGRLPRRHQPQQQEMQASTANPVKILDDDLLDEDALLSSDVLAPPPAMSAAAASKAGDDCGGRQACDNCTCGRADAEKSEAGARGENHSGRPPAVPSSSCGKCGLGDAFRCASCPYLGKPAFKAGEEHLVLDLQDDL
jgi:hypothetical protein